MKIVIKSVGVWNHPNIRTWAPYNPDVIAEIVRLDIGPKSKKSGADMFSILVATPAGLSKRNDENGIIAESPLLVMRSYIFDDLWKWLESVVNSCESDTWLECVEKLRRYFHWEYDDYKEC